MAIRRMAALSEDDAADLVNISDRHAGALWNLAESTARRHSTSVTVEVTPLVEARVGKPVRPTRIYRSTTEDST